MKYMTYAELPIGLFTSKTYPDHLWLKMPDHFVQLRPSEMFTPVKRHENLRLRTDTAEYAPVDPTTLKFEVAE